MKFLSAIFCILFASHSVAADLSSENGGDQLRLDERGEIPILAWSGVPMRLSTVGRFREVKEAGFTHHLQTYGSIDDIEKVLDLADQAGLKLIVNIPRSTSPEELVGRISNSEALAGYLISDEPKATKFRELGDIVRRVQALDRENFCYINLLPTYGSKYLEADSYNEYVGRFLRTVPVSILSFDHYPIISVHGELKVRTDFYENLEIIRTHAQKHDKPFWAFALATSHWGYPVPTLSHLRYQVFNNLAYGAVGIQYFTYWTLKISRPNAPDFQQGPVDKDGNRTVVYERVKQINEEVQGLAGVFLGSTVVDVRHTGEEIPEGTRPYRPRAPFANIQTTGNGVAVSELTQGARRYLVMVNRDVEHPVEVDINLQTDAHVSTVEKSGVVEPLSSADQTIMIGPGDIRVFTWKEISSQSNSGSQSHVKDH